MFVVRGMHPGKRGKLHRPDWHGSTLTFRYDGADGHERTATLHFSHAPGRRIRGRAHATACRLKAQQRWQLKVTCELRDARRGQLESRPNAVGRCVAPRDRERAQAGALGAGAQVETSNPLFNEIITRSFLDLHMLSMRQQGQVFFAAGVPWYVALFGRDSLVTSIEMAAFEPEVGANTLRVLARHQGTRWTIGATSSRARSCTSCASTSWRTSTRSRRRRTTAASTARRCSWSCSASIPPGPGSLDLFHELRDNVPAAHWPGSTSSATPTATASSTTRPALKAGLATRAGRTPATASSWRMASWPSHPSPCPRCRATSTWPGVAWPSCSSGTATRQPRKPAPESAAAVHGLQPRVLAVGRRTTTPSAARPMAASRSSIASNPAHALWTGIVDPKHARGRGRACAAAGYVQRLGHPHPFGRGPLLQSGRLPGRQRLAARQRHHRRRHAALRLR